MVAPSKGRRNALLLSPLILFPALMLAALYLFRESSRRQLVAAPAIYEAQASAALGARIGLPIVSGWPVRGEMTSRQGFGNANLRIPIKGSRGKGELLEWAQLQNGQWYMCSLVFRSANGSTLPILDAEKDAAKTGCQPE